MAARDAVRLANGRMGGRFLGDSPVFGADLRFFRTRRVRSCPPAPDAARTKANRAEGNMPYGKAVPAPGVVFHSDKGCQYTSGDYATLADDLAVCVSTGRTGQCWDNALAESFFASLKGECLDHQPWPTRAAARQATVEYIAWFNGTRLHSALGYMTPDEFETATDEEVVKQVA